MMIKKEITVSQTISISSPVDKVAFQIYHFEKFITWSPWAKLDTAMKFEFFGSSGQVGAKYTWTGNDKVGTGSQELVEVSTHLIETKLIFTSPWESESDISYHLSEKGKVTSVTWSYLGEMPFLMTFFVDLDEILGDKYEEGLESLKVICEQ
jgi:hypothetical protein